MTRFPNLRTRSTARVRRHLQPKSGRFGCHLSRRPLIFESLEGRRLLATITVTNTMDWDGGTITGSGKVVLDDGSSPNQGNTVVMNISDGDETDKILRGGLTLESFGTVNWTGAEKIRIGEDATIENKAFALFDIQGDADLLSDVSANGIFNNAGILQKSDGSATTRIHAVLNNTPRSVR